MFLGICAIGFGLALLIGGFGLGLGLGLGRILPLSDISISRLGIESLFGLALDLGFAIILGFFLGVTFFFFGLGSLPRTSSILIFSKPGMLILIS